VAGSQAGDFVKVAGDIHEVIKTSPTAVADLVRLAGGTAGRGFLYYANNEMSWDSTVNYSNGNIASRRHKDHNCYS